MYTTNELKEIMLEQDEKVGNYKETKRKDLFQKRLKRLGKFTEVTQFVISQLKEMNIKFTLAEMIYTPNMKKHITTDIFLPQFNIVIRQVDENDKTDLSKYELYFKYTKTSFYPLFIRSSETKEFVLEKLRNCMVSASEQPKKGYKSVKFVPAKHKRQRIKVSKAVKVEPRYKH